MDFKLKGKISERSINYFDFDKFSCPDEPNADEEVAGLSYLTKEEMTNYVKNLPPGVIKFIEKVHFNPQHPENSNLRITNKKDSLIQVRKKNKWIFEDKIDVITNLLSQKYQILEEHLSILTDNDLTLKDKRVIDRFRNNYEENVKYVKDIIKRIELLYR